MSNPIHLSPLPRFGSHAQVVARMRRSASRSGTAEQRYGAVNVSQIVSIEPRTLNRIAAPTPGSTVATCDLHRRANVMMQERFNG